MLIQKYFKKYPLLSVFMFALSACSDQAEKISDTTVSETQKANLETSSYGGDYPHLPKPAVAKAISDIASQNTFSLSSQHIEPQKKPLFHEVCHQLKDDFVAGQVEVISPQYIAQSQTDFEQTAPKPFKVFEINDVYVEHNGGSVKYSSPQAPFEFYQVELGGAKYQFMHTWFSKLADKKGRYDSKGTYSIYNAQDQNVLMQTLDYSSNGHHADLASSEGFHVLFQRNASLYLINTRQYFNPQTSPDFLTIKQFDPSKGEFLSMCNFYGGFLARK